MRFPMLWRIFGLSDPKQIEDAILQVHQCFPEKYRQFLGLPPDAPLGEVDRVLRRWLGCVSDDDLPRRYEELLGQIAREMN